MTTTPLTESPPKLAFAVESAHPVPYAAAPAIGLALHIESDLPVRSLSLTVQVRIVPTARPYDDGEQRRLVELFGAPERWGETLRGLLWTQTQLLVAPFAESTTVELPVACTYDLEVAAAKYFHALGDGDVPLELLFSGTVFYAGEGGLLRTAFIPWEAEAQFRLPVRVWRETMEHYFPGAAWLRLRRDVFDRLVAYKAGRALPTWDAVVEELLDG